MKKEHIAIYGMQLKQYLIGIYSFTYINKEDRFWNQ